jgi:hypothetical protein
MFSVSYRTGNVKVYASQSPNDLGLDLSEKGLARVSENDEGKK